MAKPEDVSAGDAATAAQYNALNAYAEEASLIHSKYRIPIWWHGLSEGVSGGTVTQKGVDVKLASGGTNDNYAQITGDLNKKELAGSLFDKNPIFEIAISLSEITASVFSFGVGFSADYDAGAVKYFGFMVTNGALSAVSRDGTTRSETNLSTALSADTTYRIKQQLVSGALHTWVDNVAKANKTTNLPTGALSQSYLFCGKAKRTTATLDAYILASVMEWDL